MAAPTKNGRYLAKVTAIVITPKDTGSVQAQLDFECLEYLNGETPEACHDERCREWFTIINKNGQPNEINVNQLRDSLGWTGSFAELAGMDLKDTEVVVQIVVADRTGNDGKTYKEVKYLNPKDYAGPGPQETSQSTIQDLESRYGALLRAMAPKNGTPKAAAAAKPAASSPNAQGKDLAYREMQLKVKSYNNENPLDPIGESQVNDCFVKLFKEHFPNKKGSDLTKEDWASFREHIKQNWSAAIMAEVPF